MQKKDGTWISRESWMVEGVVVGETKARAAEANTILVALSKEEIEASASAVYW